jgi:hypothetical protein
MKCWHALVMWMILAGALDARDVLTAELPTRVNPKLVPFSKQNLLNLDLVSVAPKSAGYRAIKCSVLALKTKPVDRQFTIRLFLRNWSQNQQRIITVEQSGELSSGATKASVFLRLPQPGNWDYFGLETFVDGRRDDELCQEYITTNTSPPASGATPEFQVFRLNSGQKLRMAVGPPQSAVTTPSTQTPLESYSDVREYIQLNGFAVEEITGDWQKSPLDYSTYDAVVIHQHHLERVAKDSPKQLDSLISWVASGGLLWIEGSGESPESLAKILVELPWLGGYSAMAVPAKSLFENQDLGWEFVKPKQPDALVDTPLPTRAADSGDWYCKRRFGFGEIYAFRSFWKEVVYPTKVQSGGNVEPLIADTVAHWRARAWAQRHGLQPDAANSEYSTFLIPGVGLAPVVEFEVLITLFVLIIGPLNYLLLRAYDRLHLMVLTTPLCALVASAGLFGYAVIADGFGAKARMRSVTLLDQASGEMANLGRVSLYAGITPSEGLSVPADTAIYPILPGWNEYSASEVRQPPKELVWTDDTQQLTSGWIPSRTTAQYYTLRANKTERKLRIAAAPDKVRVTNELGAAIEWLFVNDDANKTWIAPKLAEGASAQLKPIEKVDAIGQLRELCLAADPQFPAGYDSDMSVNSARNRRLYRQSNGTMATANLDYSNITAGNSLMEQYLDELSGLTGAEALNLPPRSYVAITSDPTEQPVPLKDAEQLSGFHVTVGRW